MAPPDRATGGQRTMSGSQACSPELLPHQVWRSSGLPVQIAWAQLRCCESFLVTADATLPAQQDGCLSRCRGHCLMVLHMSSCGCLCCRSSLATPRILTPAGARRTDVRVSDEVVWRESVDSTSAAAGRGPSRAGGGPSLGECTCSAAAGGWELAVPACTGSKLGCRPYHEDSCTQSTMSTSTCWRASLPLASEHSSCISSDQHAARQDSLQHLQHAPR